MDRVCPLLGLAGDRRTAVNGVDGGHRCHADDPPSPLDRSIQSQLCLTAEHERCDRWLQHITRTGTPTPGRAALADGLVSTRMLLAPQPAWRGIAGRARPSRPIPFIAAGAGLAAIGIAGVTLAGGLIGGSLDGLLVSSADATPSLTARPTPSPTATPSPSATPSATPSPTPSPTPVPATPTPTPAPTPVAQRTYVVVEGDNLAVIAQRFGTTVAAIQAANGIEDPNVIVVGQVLIIP